MNDNATPGPEWQGDAHFLELQDALARLLENGNQTKRRLLDMATQTYADSEKHPVVVLARRAMKENATDAAKETMLQRLLEETGNSVTGTVRYCAELFDAVIANDRVTQRQALKELARKRTEWQEAV